MNSRRKSQRNDLNPATVLLAAFVFALGYFMLNYVATWEKIQPGPTFYIIFGCIFMSMALLFIGRGLYKKYFGKKKKRNSSPVFLKKDDTNTPI